MRIKTHRLVYDNPKQEAKAREKYEKAIKAAYDAYSAVIKPADRAYEEAVAKARKQYALDAGPYKVVRIKWKRM
jgi:hypothetical protein